MIMNANKTLTPRVTFTGANTHYEPLSVHPTDPAEDGKAKAKVLTEAELRSAFLLAEGIGAEWSKALRRLLKIEELPPLQAAQQITRTYRRMTVEAIAKDVERARNAISFRPLLFPLLRWDDPCGAAISYEVKDSGRSVLVTVRVKGNSLMLRSDRTGVIPRAPLWTAWIDSRSGDVMLSVMPTTMHKEEMCLEDWWLPMNAILMAWGHPSRGAPRRKVLNDRT
jgi:hypothetical protein